MSVVSKKFSASLYSMLVLLLLCLVTAFSSGCGSKASLDPAKPVTLTIWHVYGNQTNSPFNDTIEKFNASEGKAKGVIVKVASVSSSNVIDKALFASAKQDPALCRCPTFLPPIRVLSPQCTISCCIGTNILIKKI